MTNISLWLSRKLPPVLVRETERVGLSTAFIGVGLLFLLSLPPHADYPSHFPSWLAVELAATFILGGVLTIYGMATARRAQERAGMLLAAFGCLSYSLAIFAVAHHPRQFVLGVLFLILFLVKVIRLMVSTAASTSEGQS